MADTPPSFDRPAVSRPAAAGGVRLAAHLNLGPFRLAGGTALAWGLGHRRSDDLDFFTREPGGLALSVQERLGAQMRQLDPSGGLNLSERTIHATVTGCRVSFFEIEGRWVRPPVSTAEGLWLASVDDVAAMKMVAIQTRSAKKDFYDLHALKRHGYGAQRLYDLARAAMPAIDAEVAHLLVRCLVDFTDAELDPDPISLDNTTWDMARRSAEQVSKDLQALLKRGIIR